MINDRPTKVDLGNAVRLLREERRWSLEVLADHAGIHATSVGRVERAKASPRWDTVAALSLGLGIPTEDLVAHATRECFRRQAGASPSL